MAIVDLISSGLGLLRSQNDISNEWVQGVLRASGDLDANTSVTGLNVERIGEGVGILSELYRISPTYSGATSAPKSVVVKFPTQDPGQRFTADALVLYIRELVFYRDIAPGAPFATPRCFAQAIAGDNTDFTIVMEDISGLRVLNQLEGVSLEDAGVILDKLADFHAQWWENPQLDSMLGTFQPLSNPTYHAVLPMLWQGGWPAVMQYAPEVVPAEVAAIGDVWAEKVQWMLDTLMGPRTLCHGDYRADNIMFNGNEPVVIDFQISGVGSGIYDVGYFISQSIDAKVRKGHDRELVNRYADRLATHGINVDRDEMWRQYQVTIAFCVTYSVTNYPQFENMNDRGKDLLRDMLRRSLQAVVDNDALAAIM
jgi:hypothetical protein